MTNRLLTYLHRALTPQPKGCEDRSASLSATQLAQVERSLTNPAVRVPLRADFPAVLSIKNPAHMLEVITAELAKRGKTLHDAGEITIAYPQKDLRLFPRYNNIKGELASYEAARAFKKAWKAAGHRGRFPVKLHRADMIGETVYLDRSHNQDSLHVLTQRQQYVARRNLFGRTIPFLRADHAMREHFFIIADQYVDQGTTIANLASYITHNGGHVLAVVRQNDGVIPFVPRNNFGAFDGQHTELKGVFGAAANNRALPALGFFLARSAERDGITISRDDALQNVEDSISRYGHSLTALTHFETLRLSQSLQLRQVTYAQLAGLPEPQAIPLIKQHPARAPSA